MTPRDLFKRLRASLLDVGFFSDDALVSLLQSGHALSPEAQAAVEGELLCRLWLYGKNTPKSVIDALSNAGPVVSSAVKYLAPDFKRDSFHMMLTLCSLLADSDKLTLQKFNARKSAFEQAHGLIPVVDAAGEAFPVPFRLEQESSSRDGIVILDEACQGVPSWEDCAEGLSAAIGNKGWRINLSCVQPVSGNMLVGGSFALPVWLAFHWMNRGVPALSWLASGAIAEGRLKPVEGLQAKRRLAEKLGVQLWLTVGSSPSISGGLSFSGGTSLNEVRGIVEEALEHHGLVPLSEASILAQAASLEVHVERKMVDYATARTRAEKWQQWLNENGKKQRPAYLKTLVILAAIDNHSGHAARADAYFREILGINWRHSALDRFQAINQFVVSLSDRMMLEDAEQVGRKLVAEIEAATFGSEEDYLLHKLGAIGALGGEVLLFKALRGSGCEQEAKACLDEAAQTALQLIHTCGSFDSHRYHYSKSAVRTVLWTALFEPEQIEEAEKQVRSNLEALAAENPVSLAFLSRHRLLAAYRLWKLQGKVEGNLASLSVVEPRNTSDNWLTATSLKYRGALFAASGKFDKAEADFKKAEELLREADGPLIQVIYLSILLQANELFVAAGRPTLFPQELQLEVLAKIPADTFDPSFWEEWTRRAQGDLTVDPQKTFPY
jgi:tetratricopeptide (TPR) repeat protein